MLRRNSCRSQNHRPLSRSRSSVSIVRNPVHELTSIEPFTAERDAYLAATLSYNRAQPPSKGGGKASRLHRQQSIRFAGPNAQPQRRLATRASMAMADNINMPRRPVGSQHLSQSTLESGEDALSLPYAKLRKSRSIGDRSDVFDGWMPTPSRYSSLVRKENEPLRSFDGPALRTPKSMGFLSNDCESPISRASVGSGHASNHQARNGYEPHAPNSTSFPKSLRSSSNNTSVLPSTHLYGARLRLKGIFSFPRKHHQDLESNDGSRYRGQTPTRHPQEASLYSVVSRMPSYHAGSLGTIEAEDIMLGDDKSRVTSWTNSTADTIANQPRSANWSRQEAALSSDGWNSMYRNSMPHAGPIVNSQRVHQNQSLGEDQMASDPVEAHSPQSTSTIRRQPLQPTYEGSTHTIRHVQYEDDVFQDFAEGSTTSHYSSESTKSVIRRQQSSDPGTGEGTGHSPDKNDMKPHAVAENQKPTLSSRSSAFFASPTCHLFRTTSPYRRALQESMRAAQASDRPQTPDTKYLVSLSSLSLPIRRPSIEESDDDVRMAYAESVPSPPLRSTEDESGPQVHGDATIFLNTERQRLPLQGHHTRDSSSASSVEWKTWLSANVSKLETPPTTQKPDLPQGPSSTPQTFSHVREEAEIVSDGDDCPQDIAGADWPRRVPSRYHRSPTVLAALARGKPHLANPWHPQSTATNENSPPASGARPKSLRGKETSPVVAKGNLRTIPSVANVNSCAANVESFVGEPRMSSLNTFAKPFDPARAETHLKRRSRARLGANDTSAKSSPGFTTALKRQFGVSRTGSPGIWKAEEPPSELGSETDAGVDELGRRDFDAQAMGSRRMVELFLSSRQQRTAGNQMRQSSDSMSAAFI
ncbi:hypothetical protein V8C42DRAFT_352137 [Trichoderma barbatum]